MPGVGWSTIVCSWKGPRQSSHAPEVTVAGIESTRVRASKLVSMEMRRLLVFLIFSLPVLATASKAQSNAGELRLKLTDPSGPGVHTSIDLLCPPNHSPQPHFTDGPPPPPPR